jgi:hypothetical protein
MIIRATRDGQAQIRIGDRRYSVDLRTMDFSEQVEKMNALDVETRARARWAGNALFFVYSVADTFRQFCAPNPMANYVSMLNQSFANQKVAAYEIIDGLGWREFKARHIPMALAVTNDARIQSLTTEYEGFLRYSIYDGIENPTREMFCGIIDMYAAQTMVGKQIEMFQRMNPRPQ